MLDGRYAHQSVDMLHSRHLELSEDSAGAPLQQVQGQCQTEDATHSVPVRAIFKLA